MMTKQRSEHKQKVVPFGPAHFPVGTKFMVDQNERSMERYRDEIFEVLAVHRNGPRSFVLETTALAEPDGPKIFPEGMKHSFNVSWVDRIVSRGAGKIYNSDLKDPHEFTNRVVKDSSFYTPPETTLQFLRSKGVRVGRNHYVFYTYEIDVFASLVIQALGTNRMLEYQRMLSDMIDSHPEWTTEESQRFRLVLLVVPKKDFKRWVRRNVNRYLVNLDAWQAREDQWAREEAERYWKDVEDALDLELEEQDREMTKRASQALNEYQNDPAMDSHYDDEYLSFDDDDPPALMGDEHPCTYREPLDIDKDFDPIIGLGNVGRLTDQVGSNLARDKGGPADDETFALAP